MTYFSTTAHSPTAVYLRWNWFSMWLLLFSVLQLLRNVVIAIRSKIMVRYGDHALSFPLTPCVRLYTGGISLKRRRV